MFLKGNLVQNLWGRSPYGRIVLFVGSFMILAFFRANLTRKIILNVIGSSEILTNAYLRWNNLNESERYLCPVMTGRLGNLMFIFGASYLLAKQTNMTLLISYDGSMLYSAFPDIFEKSHIVYRDTKRICRVFGKHQKRTNKQVIDSSILRFLRMQNASVKLFSYFQSYKNFENHENEIRNLYKFNAAVRRLVYTELLDARHSTYPAKTYKEVTYIGVHIRRGDILTSKRGYNSATPVFLRKAMHYFHRKFKNALFIVRSNGNAWTTFFIKRLRRKIPHMRIVMPSKYDSITDLAMLTSCNHSIITVGTFSWWSGWLTGGQVIYYKNAALPGTKYDSFLNEGTYYPPGWIGLA